MDLSWDKFKGFFRRQAQYVNQNYRNVVEPTKDEDFDNMVTIVDGLQALAGRTSVRLKKLAACIDESVTLCNAASLDPPPDQFQWDDMARLNKKLAHATEALTPHSNYLKKVLTDHSVQLDRFVNDVAVLAQLKADRASALLEYDFFRHKLMQLRADPPADPQRIPRNEGRVKEFGDLVDGYTGRLKQAMTGLMATGERLCSVAHQMMGAELHRYADESQRAWISAQQMMVALPAVQVATAMAPAATPSGGGAQQGASAAALPTDPAAASPAGGGAAATAEVASPAGATGAQPARPASVMVNKSTRNLASTVDDPFRM